MVKMLLRFFRDKAAATAIEYGLIAAVIAMVIITSLGSVGTKVNTKLGTVATTLR